MSHRVQATYVSVWDDGIEIESSAMFDLDTGILDEIQMAPLPEDIVGSLNVLTGEFVRCGGKQYALRNNDDGTYNAIRPYGVYFSRCGYAQVMACSRDEAMKIADEQLTCDQAAWDDDWPATDAQLED